MYESTPISSRRESGDGAPCPVISKSLSSSKLTNDVTRPTHQISVKSNTKLERITKEIQNTWLRRHLSQPRSASRLLDLEEQRKSVVLPAILPKGRLIQLIPSGKHALEVHKSVSKNHELKFVPYEPYKAAVTPMCHQKTRRTMEPKQTHKRGKSTNIDLNVLVSQVSSVKSNEMHGSLHVEKEKTTLDTQREYYEQQIDALRKEKTHIEKQLKFQAQVNSELKNLLVNAVSQDETFVSDRITSMTEDKLHLAQKLLTSAEDLSNRSEMLEYYTGQIEVWRSRFLASGVMIEELARWKTSLLQRNHLLIKSNKKLMETVGRCRDMQVEILSNLAFLDGVSKKLEIETANIMDISKENVALSQHLALQSTRKVGMPNELNLNGLETMTEGEKMALQALQTSDEPLISTEELLKTILGQNFILMQQQKRIQEEKQEAVTKETGVGVPKVV